MAMPSDKLIFCRVLYHILLNFAVAVIVYIYYLGCHNYCLSFIISHLTERVVWQVTRLMTGVCCVAGYQANDWSVLFGRLPGS